MYDHIVRRDMEQTLEGDRNWITSRRGDFVVRHNPEHVARVRAEKARLRVEEDIRNFRRLRNRRRNDLVLS